MYTVSPVFADGMIYGMSNKRRGQFVALDAENGAVKWATQGRDGNHASILQTNEHLLFLTDGAVLIVARRTAGRLQGRKALRARHRRHVVVAGVVAGRIARPRGERHRQVALV